MYITILRMGFGFLQNIITCSEVIVVKMVVGIVLTVIKNNMVCLITGGERSGKSKYAQDKALILTQRPAYLATARKWDDDFAIRIDRHRKERDERWTTIEEEKYISKVSGGEVIVLDCITLWLSNIFSDTKGNVSESLAFAKEELAKAFQMKCHWIFVTNEIGMGVHASTEAGRKFVELQGWTNQFIAAQADEVFLMVSGIPLQVKRLRPV